MRIPGQRIKRTRLVQSEKYVVAVEVEMVIPVDDPSEPCYESETVQLLREIKEHADRGDVAWLTQHGKVYAAGEAAKMESTARMGALNPAIVSPLRQMERHWSDSNRTERSRGRVALERALLNELVMPAIEQHRRE